MKRKRPSWKKKKWRKSYRRQIRLLNRVRFSGNKFIRRTGYKKKKNGYGKQTLQKALANPNKELFFKLMTPTSLTRFYRASGQSATHGFGQFSFYPDPRNGEGQTNTNMLTDTVYVLSKYGVTNLWNYYKYFTPLTLKVSANVTNHQSVNSLLLVWYVDKKSDELWNGESPTWFYSKVGCKMALLTPRDGAFPRKFIKVSARCKDYITDSPYEQKYRSDKDAHSSGLSEETVQAMKINFYFLALPLLPYTKARNELNLDITFKVQLYGKFTDYQGTIF